ncbi:MAG: hypothetical protein EPN97_16385 [Alphaproteobacteria bacterium]|nr:MAG: hypothetical protein EPN97_16385 [Alphaproteobacteria bacterium]
MTENLAGEEIIRRLPWPLRALKSLLISLAVIAFLIWLAITLALNYFEKDALEAQLSRSVGKKVSIRALRAGWDIRRPTVAITGIAVGDDPDHPVAEADVVEAGFYLGGPDFDIDNAMYYAGIRDLKIGGKLYGSYEAKFRQADRRHYIVPELTGELKGARLKGNLAESDNEWKADLGVDNLDYSLLAPGVTGGKARLTLRLTLVDTTFGGAVRSLSGRATLVGGDGKLEGNALNLWAGSLLTSFLPGRDKDTHLNCAVADFDVKNGVAHSRTVIIDTDKATITGDGTVDLVKGRVDMRFSPQTKGMASVSLGTPVIVSGPFDNITTHPEVAGIVEKAGGLILSAVASPVALLPFLHIGKGNPCEKYLEEKTPP